MRDRGLLRALPGIRCLCVQPFLREPFRTLLCEALFDLLHPLINFPFDRFFKLCFHVRGLVHRFFEKPRPVGRYILNTYPDRYARALS